MQKKIAIVLDEQSLKNFLNKKESLKAQKFLDQNHLSSD
nr:hypothetical protein B11C_120036 [Bartonella sp. 1-1C]